MHHKQRKERHHFFRKIIRNINPVIRLLIISDMVLVGAAGLLGPIFALFVEEFIQGGNETVAGVAAGIYLISRSIFQIPIASMMDRKHNEKYDFLVMFIFTLIGSLIPLFYLIIDTPLELYIIQFAIGICTAFTYPSYMIIFLHYMDKGKEGTEWSIYYTLTDVIGAILSMIGGYVAATEGFPILIIAVASLSVLGSLILWPITSHIGGKRKKA